VCWFVLTHLATFLVDLVTVRRRTDRDKDLQILLLQHQVRLLQRQRPPPRLTRWEKLTLAVLASKLARLTAGPRTGLERAVLLFKPDTVLRWHRELVRRKWTCRRPHAGGRPPLPAEVEAYPDDVRRRLVVKPGMTGLWQVSGRSDLPWEEAVRLDLRYVENWSLALDFLILWKTARAVLSSSGAY
jgi:hypothetical protein